MDTQAAFRCFAEGDGGAFESALAEFYRRISGHLFRHRVNGEDHADLTQDAIVRVLRNRHKLCGAGVARVCSWLKTVCEHLWLDLLRRAGRRMSKQGDMEPPAPIGSEDGVTEALERCIDRLPESHGRIFELHHTADWSAAEIAELYRKSPEWVWQKLRQAKHMLRECLQKHGHDVSE